MTKAHCTSGAAHRIEDTRIALSYEGGERIDAFRGRIGPVHGPEDWVGSVWQVPPEFVRAEQRDDWGLSYLPDGRLLRDAIADDPVGWLGEALARLTHGTPGVLVKLIDAGERLPVHFHPSRVFARAYLSAPYGKSEGWVILEAEPGAAAWLGFKEAVSREIVREWIDRQDDAAMLSAMNRYDVVAGDAIYVPAGLPHAFGPGILLCELQEPTSFSIHMEHVRFGMDEDVATLGLGWDTALRGLGTTRMTAEYNCVRRASWMERNGAAGSAEHLFPAHSRMFFDAQRLAVRGSVEFGCASFAVVVVTGGEGTLLLSGGDVPLTRGTTYVIPHGAGVPRLAGDVDLVLCLPPDADARA